MAVHSEHISDSSIAQSVCHAVEDWKSSLSVRTWCRDYLPTVIADRLPGFCRELAYGARSSLMPLLDILAMEQVDVPGILALGISKHVEDLSAVVVYELARLIGQTMMPADVANALGDYLPRLVRRIPPQHLERMNTADIPADLESAVGTISLCPSCRIVMSGFVGERLPTQAYGVSARLGAAGRLWRPGLWCTIVRPTEAFRAAKMSLSIGWPRDCGGILRFVGSRTRTSLGHCPASTPSCWRLRLMGTFPHVLIRSFAKRCRADSQQGRAPPLLSSSQKKTLSRANTGHLQRKKGRRSYGRAGTHQERASKDRAFHFDFYGYPFLTGYQPGA